MLAAVECASVRNPTPVGVGGFPHTAVCGACGKVSAHSHTQQNQQTTGNSAIQCASVRKACGAHVKIKPFRTLKTRRRISGHYRAENLECAAIIAADPVRYPGLMQEWADMILSRAAAPPAEREAGSLFQKRRAA